MYHDYIKDVVGSSFRVSPIKRISADQSFPISTLKLGTSDFGVGYENRYYNLVYNIRMTIKDLELSLDS